MIPRELRNLAHFAATLAAVTCLASCGLQSPWDQEPVESSAGRDTAPREFFANDASFGKWVDKRPQSTITHGMLVVDGPKERKYYFAPNSTVVITTTNDVIAKKLEDMVAGRLGVPAGMTTNFAIGNTTSVKIERIGQDGVRTSIDEGRVSFLEIVAR